MQNSMISFQSQAPYSHELPEQVSPEQQTVQKNGTKKLSERIPSNDFLFQVDELKKTLLHIPPIAQLNINEQQNLFFTINIEQQNILEKSSLHGKKIYISKTDDKTEKGNHKTPWSFYLTVDPFSQSVTLELNEKKSEESLLGNGDYKKWQKGYEIKKSIELHSKKIKGSEKAIARPHSLLNFEVEFAMPMKMHQDIYDEIIKLNLPGRVSKPPIIREHYKREIKKSELVQNRIQGTVKMILPKKTHSGIKYQLPINYEKRLFLLECLFTTVDTFGILGVTHRDIKPSNLALKGKLQRLYPEVNDFDFVSKDSVGLSDPSYFRWDVAGQLGLISNASDLIASMLTACEILFLPPKNVFEDPQHKLFKMGDLQAVYHLILPELNEQLIKFNLAPLDQPSIENIFDLCNQSISKFVSKKDPIAIKYFIELKYNIQILQIFCSYFEREDRWRDQLLGSCICHFMNLSKEYKSFLTHQDRGWFFATSINLWAKDQLSQILDDEILSLLNLTESEFSYEGTATIFNKLRILYDKGSLQTLMTPEKMFKFNSVQEQFISLINISQMQKWPEEGDPELFSLLNSKDPEKQKKAREIGFANFGRGRDISDKIKKISVDYLNELKEIQSLSQASNK
jgi:hypothetical protein